MNEVKVNEQKWSKFDNRWMLSLFGTAVGAGILYLPIKAGAGGFWPVVAMIFIIFPMVFLSHRALSRFVASASGDDKDITHAAGEHFGMKISIFISILYFFAIFPICLAYCVGITNTFESFIFHQFLPLLDENSGTYLAISSMYTTHISSETGVVVGTLLPFYRGLFAFVLVTLFMLVMLFREEFITKVCEILVYPLCIILFLFSIYLIPEWNLAGFSYLPNFKDFFMIVWLTFPVLVFSFNHSPAISTFTLSVKNRYENVDFKSNQILFRTASMLLFFVMFFVISCTLSLTPAEFSDARSQNIPVLSYFANKLENPIISYGGPVVAFLAIASSFFGHYFGAREGAYGVVRKFAKLGGNDNPNMKKIATISTLTMYLIMLVVAYINPSVLGFIETLGGPIIAAILFLMPVIAIYKASKMAKFKNPALDAFVFITGLLTIITIILV